MYIAALLCCREAADKLAHNQTKLPTKYEIGLLGSNLLCNLEQESPADARVMSDSYVIPRLPSDATLEFIEPQIAPFDPPTLKTLT